jgi:GR25 family glycosyltransferase involved in LPS biosynthesis
MTDFTTYWINLDKSENRKENMEKFFNKYNIKNERISAVYGKEPENLKQLADFVNDVLPNNQNLGQFGCFFSHLKTIKHFLDNDINDFCLILEDDCDFSVFEKYNLNFNKVINKIKKDNWREWDIIQLSVICGGNKEFITKPNFKYMKWRKCFYSCLAYIINKNGAKKIINSILNNNNKFNINLTNKTFKDYVADYYLYANSTTYTYKIPFFNQNIIYDSTLVSNKATHIKAYHNIINIVNFYDHHLKTLYPINL